MGIYFRKSKKVADGTNVNVSTKGASVSKKAGPISLSSRGNVNVNLGKGLNFRKKLF